MYFSGEEIPDNHLERDINKVIKVNIDKELYLYLISLEDIIIDRLRATAQWRSEVDGVWGFKLLANNFSDVDVSYIEKRLQGMQEEKEFAYWLKYIKNYE